MNNNIKTKNIPFWISVTIFVVLFLAIGIYTYRNMKYVFSGVTVEARIEKAEKESNLFNLNGNAKHANFISINGREISIDKNGDFKEKIVLPDGYSIITIFARDKPLTRAFSSPSVLIILSMWAMVPTV